MEYIENLTNSIDRKVDAERYVEAMMDYIENRPNCGGKRALLYYCNYILQYNEVPSVRWVERELGLGVGVLREYLNSHRRKLMCAICRTHSMSFREVYAFIRDY